MKIITTLSNDAKQNIKLVLSDNSVADLTLEYSDNQKGWFYSITYGTWSSYGRRLVTSPNALRAFRNIVPFGLACYTTDGYEPVDIDDFKNGRVKLYLLTIADVALAESYITTLVL